MSRREAGADGAPWRLVLLRAAFLACSWTWCIGMFLPALLIADFGWPGWVVFAVPNVVGAAAMGLVLRRRGAPAELRERFGGAAAWFSRLTLAFHAFFVSWVAIEWLTLPAYELTRDAPLWAVRIVQWTSNPAIVASGALAAVFVTGMLASLMSFRALCRLAAAVWLVSMALAVDAFVLLPEGTALAPAMTGVSHWSGLLWLAPACVFGFALCPYLDLTFLRAREETPGRAGDRAFLIGFGGLFLAMIALTLLYSGGIVQRWWVSRFIVAHMVVQSIFTVAAHARELRLLERPRGRATRAVWIAAPVFAGLIPLGLYEEMRNEAVYRAFMGAYGLVFPAYVWIVMVPRRRGASQGARMVVFAIAVVLAAPLFWIGFIGREWWALGPGVAIVVAAPLVFRSLVAKEPAQQGGARQQGPIQRGAGAMQT